MTESNPAPQARQYPPLGDNYQQPGFGRRFATLTNEQYRKIADGIKGDQRRKDLLYVAFTTGALAVNPFLGIGVAAGLLTKSMDEHYTAAEIAEAAKKAGIQIDA